MGLCFSDNVNSQIAKAMQNQETVDNSIKKILLLGSGSSGKSTLFKQLKYIYGDGIDSQEREESASVIRQNCVGGILTILRNSHGLYEKDHETYAKCKLDLEDEEIATHVKLVIDFGNFPFIDNFDFNEMGKLGESIFYLWELPSSRETYNHRRNFAFPENMDHFFKKVKEIMSEDYDPDIDDILKARIRTTGIIETSYLIQENLFHLFDVGGQRNERKKWIHLFQDVTAVIYVTALNHYNALLFEDETINAMHESIQLFSELCNSKWLRKAEIILFLNKDDLFRECLKSEIPLSVCFSKNAGWTGKQWEGPDYKVGGGEKEDAELFEWCYTSALTFIEEQFTLQCQIFKHVTTATIKNNIEKVFWDVQNITIRSNLKRGGIMA